MREVAKGLYVVDVGHAHAPEVARMWHDCKEHKNRRKKRQGGTWRPELIHKGGGKYICEHCGFKYPA